MARVNAGKNSKSRQELPTIQLVHRTYITLKEGIHGRMKPDLFESFLDYTYSKKYQKTSPVAVDPMSGLIEGYGDELKEMFQETEVRSRAVAYVMVLQIAKEKEKMMEGETKEAMDIILDKADENGKKRERDDVLTYGGMEEFIGYILTSSIQTDIKTTIYNQIATVEAISKDLYNTQQVNA